MASLKSLPIPVAVGGVVAQLCTEIAEFQVAADIVAATATVTAAAKTESASCRILSGPLDRDMVEQIRRASTRYRLPALLESKMDCNVVLLAIVFDAEAAALPQDWRIHVPLNLRPFLKHPHVLALPLALARAHVLRSWQPTIAAASAAPTSSSSIHAHLVDVTTADIAGGDPLQGTLFPALQQPAVTSASVTARDELEWAAQAFMDKALEIAFALQQVPSHTADVKPITRKTMELACGTFHPVQNARREVQAHTRQQQLEVAPQLNARALPPIPPHLAINPSAFPREPPASKSVTY
jgi:hypothetical protein